MTLKRKNVQKFCKKFHKSIGASETIPNLTLPVHELFERLTDHTLDGIRAASLMYGNVPIKEGVDPMDYVNQLCLADTCIDLTDQAAITAELYRQLDIASERQAELKKVINKAKPEQSTEAQETDSPKEIRVE